jgi:hypothetical protein
LPATPLQKRRDKVARQALRDKAFWRPVAFQSGCRPNDESHPGRTEATPLSARGDPHQRALVRRVRELAMEGEQHTALLAVEDWPNVDGSDFETADRVTRDGRARLTC